MKTIIYNPLPKHIEVVVLDCPEGGFTSVCPGMPGAQSQGETREEAVENLKDALRQLWKVREDDCDAQRRLYMRQAACNTAPERAHTQS